MKRLTAYEELVLLAASTVDDIPHYKCIPYFVYRALVNRNLLTKSMEHYELTGEGRLALEHHLRRPA